MMDSDSKTIAWDHRVFGGHFFIALSPTGWIGWLVMHCPYCQALVYPGAPECPACRLSYPKASALLGVVPRLAPALADTTHRLRPGESLRLKRRIAAIQQRFPQLVLQVVLHRFPSGYPLSLHTFWLFNAAQFAGNNRRGKDNHALLLVIDPGRSEAALMPGYGLESLLTDEALGHLLELAGTCWDHCRWADGILRVLDGLDAWLETLAVPDMEPSMPDSDF